MVQEDDVGTSAITWEQRVSEVLDRLCICGPRLSMRFRVLAPSNGNKFVSGALVPGIPVVASCWVMGLLQFFLVSLRDTRSALL